MWVRRILVFFVSNSLGFSTVQELYHNPSTAGHEEKGYAHVWACPHWDLDPWTEWCWTMEGRSSCPRYFLAHKNSVYFWHISEKQLRNINHCCIFPQSIQQGKSTGNLVRSQGGQNQWNPNLCSHWLAKGGRCLGMQKLYLEESLTNICFFR